MLTRLFPFPAAAAALLLLSPGAVAQTVNPAATVSMFRGNPAHSGVYASPAPPGVNHIVWQFRTGAPIVASPTIADGTLYIGSDDHNLYAIDARSGRLLWKFAANAGIRSTAAVSGGSVFFLSLDGNLYSLDTRSGKLQWKFATAGESRNHAPGLYGLSPALEPMPDPWDFFLSSPAVAEGTVYFGSGDRHVYALSAQTGALRWKFLAGDVVHSSPALAGGLLCIGAWDGVLYALDARTGALRWKFAGLTDATHFMQGIPGSPAIAGHTVVFGSRDNFIYALDARTGSQLWRQPNHNSWVIASPAILNGTVYITTSDSMLFRALDLKTGAPLFELPYLAYSFSSPALASGHAYFGTFDGRLHDVDLAARRYAGQFQVQAARDHAALLTADGHLNTAAVYGPLMPDGQPNNTLDATMAGIARLLSLGSILASPVADQGIVYCASTDGSVYALN